MLPVKVLFRGLFFTAIVLSLLINCNSQIAPKRVNWVDWNDWAAKEALGNKKGFVWIHSPECDDCKEMGRTTFGHPVIIDYLNEHYHAAKLDVHFEGDINTKGKTWKYINNIGAGGYHQLAASLLGRQFGEQISYPSVVFLDENFNSIVPISQQLTTEELELLLVFVEEEHFKTMDIEQFKQQFVSKIK